MPKVSFIVIGYNIEAYIERCLESMIKQSLKEIEVIFVDDGSEDETLYKVETLAQQDKRISIIKQKNGGANAARKSGLMNAKGEYVLFVDGDDWVDINIAQKLYRIVENSDFDIISFCHFFAYDDSSQLIKKANEINETLNDKKYLELILQQKISHNLWNKFFKREFLLKSGFLDIPSITMGDDLVANVQLGIHNPNVLVINEAYYYYYQRSTSVTKQISPKVLEIKDAIEHIENILKNNDLLNIYEEEVNYLWFRHAYFCLVILSRHKTTYIQRQLYQLWEEKNINIKNNKYCLEYMKTVGILKKTLLNLYNTNYYLGYLFSRVFLKLRDYKRAVD